MGWVAAPGVEFSFSPNVPNAVTLYHAAQEMAHGGISKRARRDEDRGYHWQGIELGRRGAIEGTASEVGGNLPVCGVGQLAASDCAQ
jgi:hypothetical protein